MEGQIWWRRMEEEMLQECEIAQKLKLLIEVQDFQKLKS